MAKKPVLDILPLNLEFHNLLQTLGLSLKFRPSLRPPAARIFKDQIQDFCRDIQLHHKYADQPDDPDFNPKLYVKSVWNLPQDDPDLEETLYHMRQELLSKLQREQATMEEYEPR